MNTIRVKIYVDGNLASTTFAASDEEVEANTNKYIALHTRKGRGEVLGFNREHSSNRITEVLLMNCNYKKKKSFEAADATSKKTSVWSPFAPVCPKARTRIKSKGVMH